MRVEDVAVNICCSPRHRVPLGSRHEGTQYVLLKTWQATSGRPCQVQRCERGQQPCGARRVEHVVHPAATAEYGQTTILVSLVR